MTTSPADLAGFRAAQQLAYRCALEIAEGLAPGDTEKEAAARMRQWLQDHGVREYLHKPFAWFGERSAFRGFHTPLAFFPTSRRLEPDMPFILDCAPVVDGYTADIGYAATLGENAIQSRILDDLAAHRELILARVRAGDAAGTIYDQVTALARKQGYDIRHSAYPAGVLGHRVEKREPGRGGPTLAGFGARALVGFAKLAARGVTPLWNHRGAHAPLAPGVWAVEPHLAFRDVGAKFEELLVVDDAGARWLDDDLPHVRRAQEAA